MKQGTSKGPGVLDELLDVFGGALELSGRERLEADRTDARRLEAAVHLQRDGGGCQREEPLLRRLR